jgi:large subunit ribosomal protein L32
VAAQKALSIGKAVLSGKAQGFIYPVDEEGDDGES